MGEDPPNQQEHDQPRVPRILQSGEVRAQAPFIRQEESGYEMTIDKESLDAIKFQLLLAAALNGVDLEEEDDEDE
jgi:hypothetical protein